MLTEETETECTHPSEEVEQRKGPGGKMLDYLPSWRGIDLLNEILGPESWMDDCALSLACEYESDGYWHVTYRAEARVTVVHGHDLGRADTSHVGYGFGHGKSRSRGEAHEQAGKNAESDACKRAYRKFGRRLGLALYDKAREHVEDPAHYTNADVAGMIERVVLASSKSELERIGEQLRSEAHRFKASQSRKLRRAYEKRMTELAD